MQQDARQRASESVATNFSRAMNGATSPRGWLADPTLASAAAAVPIVLSVRQVLAGEATTPLTLTLYALSLAPIIASQVIAVSLRNAREEVVAWLAAQPFAIENMNGLLCGISDTFELTFADDGKPSPTREEVQSRVGSIAEMTLATDDKPEQRLVVVQIGVIDSKVFPIRTTFQRYEQLKRIVEQALVPLHRERPIAQLRVV